MLLISSQTWEALTGQQRGWLLQAARESSAFQRKAWDAAVEDSLQRMGVIGEIKNKEHS